MARKGDLIVAQIANVKVTYAFVVSQAPRLEQEGNGRFIPMIVRHANKDGLALCGDSKGHGYFVLAARSVHDGSYRWLSEVKNVFTIPADKLSGRSPAEMLELMADEYESLADCRAAFAV